MATFEQAIGFGFSELDPPTATARFGSFPVAVYAYTALATVANVVFSEPTSGIFSIVAAMTRGTAERWQFIHLASSVGLTVLMAFWGVAAISRARQEGWTDESRSVVALVLTLAACGALSFNYSRDRLGGMATPFYALAAYLRSARARNGRRRCSHGVFAPPPQGCCCSPACGMCGRLAPPKP